MYQPPDMSRWTGRTSPEEGLAGLLWHQVVKPLNLIGPIPACDSANKVAFLGFACDEGVKRNQGRVGAAQGPSELRTYLARHAVHFTPAQLTLFDAGDVACEEGNLEKASEELSEKVTQLLREGFFPILLGGGHEITHPHVTGIRQFVGKTKTLGLINLDAHFDLRQYPNGPHSGSGFRQLADECERDGMEFRYLPVGINPPANIQALMDFMEAKGQTFMTLQDLRSGLTGTIKQHIDRFIAPCDSLYLTLDLDVISMASAPGVSAPAPFGLSPQLTLELVLHILASGKVISLDIAELNPAYDDSRTARLAAGFVYEMVHQVAIA
jgi:formiminoglutamase